MTKRLSQQPFGVVNPALSQSERSSVRRLAWELAQTASFRAMDDGTIKAIVTFSGGDKVWGTGKTTTEAELDLASELERWANGY